MSSSRGAALYHKDSHAVALDDGEVSDFLADHHGMSSIHRPGAHDEATQSVDVVNRAASNNAGTRAGPPQGIIIFHHLLMIITPCWNFN